MAHQKSHSSEYPVVPPGSKREQNFDSRYYKYPSLQRRLPFFGVRPPVGDRIFTPDSLAAAAKKLGITRNAFMVRAIRDKLLEVQEQDFV